MSTPIEHMLTMTCYHHRAGIMFEGCAVTIVGSSLEASFKDTVAHEWKYNWNLLFNLHDVNPSSIKSAPQVDSSIESALTVDFRTTDDKNVMVLRHYQDKGAERRPVHALSDADTFAGFVMKPDYAPRFIKAFRTAVESCGGRTSAF